MLRIRKIAELVGKEIVTITPDRSIVSKFAEVVTNFEYAPGWDETVCWDIWLTIGEGPAARQVSLALAAFVSKANYELSFQTPILVQGKRTFALFRNGFYWADREPINEREKDEFRLRVKRLAYREAEEINALTSYVANIEATIEYRRTGAQREPLPDDVKLLVWSRDGGACVKCGSKSNLHFDHIIPVAKGGGNTAQNIQILCGPCNLRKSDRIASPVA